jgi:hypothetical protein
VPARFLTRCSLHSPLGNCETPPFALLVCQDEEQRDSFLGAADCQLTGTVWHPDVAPDRYEHVGRQRILFATEIDAHASVLEALRVAQVARGHVDRRGGARWSQATTHRN